MSATLTAEQTATVIAALDAAAEYLGDTSDCNDCADNTCANCLDLAARSGEYAALATALAAALAAAEPEPAELPVERQDCRYCGTPVTITRDEDGMVEQVNGAGLVMCGPCYTTAVEEHGFSWTDTPAENA